MTSSCQNCFCNGVMPTPIWEPIASANRGYDRVSAGFPKLAEHEFTTRNGKRIRIRQ
jgi:hypothetical protein